MQLCLHSMETMLKVLQQKLFSVARTLKEETASLTSDTHMLKAQTQKHLEWDLMLRMIAR